MPTTSMIYRIITIIIVIILIIGAIILFQPKRSEYLRLQKRRDALAAQNAAKTETIKELKIKQDRFSTEPAFVERTAREAGMVSKDEIVYKFKNADGRPTGGSE